MKPDARISFQLLSPNEGGRKTSIQGNAYGCPLLIDEEYFDCRFMLGNSVNYESGSCYEVDVKFLRLDLVSSRLQVGAPIELWEGKRIGFGHVVKKYAD